MSTHFSNLTSHNTSDYAKQFPALLGLSSLIPTANSVNPIFINQPQFQSLLSAHNVSSNPPFHVPPSTPNVSTLRNSNPRLSSVPKGKEPISHIQRKCPAQSLMNNLQFDIDINKFEYISEFSTTIKNFDTCILKTNSDVLSAWTRDTLTTQVPSCHIHSKAFGFRPLSGNILDPLIDTYSTFKRAIWCSKVYEYTKIYFQSNQHLLDVLESIPLDPKYSKKLANLTYCSNQQR
eukprot:TRINITY_DN439_c0_g1_i2.p1 TRINITY_DN439_c0_g1~~TRINITY_DN439_c0_g1_i2.p1  ORF type:complete len:234 (-),score=3.80 TRINITY_DN439_c0_g1_i2:1430-2131(-)